MCRIAAHDGVIVRARDLRDIIDVLVLPSLERALEELEPKGGSRARARILVRHAAEQLRGIVVQPEADRFNRMRQQERQEAGVHRQTDLDCDADPHGHDFTFVRDLVDPADASAGYVGKCRCGAYEGSEKASVGCGLSESFGNAETVTTEAQRGDPPINVSRVCPRCEERFTTAHDAPDDRLCNKCNVSADAGV